jgi:hypothetical protein
MNAIVRSGGGGLAQGGLKIGRVEFTCDRPTGLALVTGAESAFCINAGVGALLTLGVWIAFSPLAGLLVLASSAGYTIAELKGEGAEVELKSAELKNANKEQGGMEPKRLGTIAQMLADLKESESIALPPTVFESKVDPKVMGVQALIAGAMASMIHGDRASDFSKQYAKGLTKVGFKIFVLSFSSAKWQCDQSFVCTDINDQTGRRNMIADALKAIESESKAVLFFDDIDLIAGLVKSDQVSKSMIQKAIAGAPLLARDGKLMMFVGKSKVKSQGLRDVAILANGKVSIDGGQSFGAA